MNTADVHDQARADEHPHVVVTAELKAFAALEFKKQIELGCEGEIVRPPRWLVAPAAFAVNEWSWTVGVAEGKEIRIIFQAVLFGILVVFDGDYRVEFV